jgi:DNA modification methylase
MGTGTTALACKNLNMGYIGSEISLEQVKYSEERLNN